MIDASLMRVCTDFPIGLQVRKGEKLRGIAAHSALFRSSVRYRVTLRTVE